MTADLDADTTELLRVLRELVDRSGIGLRGLSAALRPEHFKGAEPPRYYAVSRCLTGDGIGNAGPLISAIVEICATPEEREAKAAQVERLKVASRAASQTRRKAPKAPAAKATRSWEAAELEAARSRIIELHEELAAARRRAEESERSLALLLGMFGRPWGVSADGFNPQAVPQTDAQDPPPKRPHAFEAGLDVPVLTRSRSEAARIETVAAELRALDPRGERIAGALRTAMDEILDGQHTGRYQLSQLHRSEKSYLGTKVEIVLANALGLEPGEQMDLSVAGCEVDLKFTMGRHWLFGAEQVGQVCLLLQLDEARSEWSAGLLLVEEDLLLPGANRDGKRPLSRPGRESIQWLFHRMALPHNTLLGLAPGQVAAILSYRSAQERVVELLRTAQHRRINPASMATVAMQPDYMKRVRDVRPRLAQEGIVVLTRHHQQSALALGLPVPEGGEVVTARLAPIGEGEPDAGSIELDGSRWALARPGDPVVPLPGPPQAH
ncbi:NaeI family type II restriction endonuclease [Kitasatospora fiedleri]|uniref:NaeI family type II restriction endonuclease n=1 Tax=Kitasatospora fiedleri TaxID=2991545 RepID=UPI00249ADB21|nr:NaeI family type II restriction endonuclease [Kitasatospora fiedleri]